MNTKAEIAALRDEYQWREVDTLPEALAATDGKTIARTLSYDEGGGMYAESAAVVLFTDGTGFAVEMDAGWGGTDVTPGDPASVEYFVLSPSAPAPHPEVVRDADVRSTAHRNVAIARGRRPACA